MLIGYVLLVFLKIVFFVHSLSSFYMISRKCECALFGDYIDILSKLMLKVDSGLPVLLVQFAKVKIFRGISL